MSKLKTFPVDLLGTAPSNKVSGEVRIIEKNEDRIFIPTGGPFYTKSLKVWAGATLLQVGKDYVAKELNRNATIDSGKEVCNAIQILNKGSHFLLEYQVIGGDYTELGEELADFIKGTPLNDLTKTHWNNILYKPTVFPPSPHTHTAPEWRGYGEAIYLVDQMYANLSTNRNSVFTAIKEEIRLRVEETVQQYIDKNGIVITDKAPTPKGNVFLIGNGKQPNPLHFDIEALYRELDDRYFRNIINPLTRIGAISDSFLPITSGFFNVSSPLRIGVNTTAVAKIERNGDLLVLTPASDGEIIRYVYGYVRNWTLSPELSRMVATNQQYRPPGLMVDEELCELYGINNQTMIGTIYKVESSGRVVFKEHAIIQLNDTLLSESHVLIRLGDALVKALGTSNPETLRNYRPTIVKPRGDYYYLIHLPNLSMGSLIVQRLEAEGSFTKLTEWEMVKETTSLKYREGEPDYVESVSTVQITNRATNGELKPFSWFRLGLEKDDDGWIIDNSEPTTGYTYTYANHNQDLYAHTEGEDVYILLTISTVCRLFRIADNAVARDQSPPSGVSIRLKLNARPKYTWVRTKRDHEPESTWCINSDRGYCRQDPNNLNSYSYKVPYDMTAGIQDYNWFLRSSQIGLADGTALIWRPPNTSSRTQHAILARNMREPIMETSKRYNGYYHQRSWDGTIQSVSHSRINLEKPTAVPLGVAAYPLNDELILLREGDANYQGGSFQVNHYLYRPSKKVVEYKTAELGTVNGYDVTDDRKFIGKFDSIPFVNVHRSDHSTRYSNMVFFGAGDKAFKEQTVHRSVKANYDAGKLEYSDPYTLTKAGYDQIEFVLRSYTMDDRHDVWWSWALIISPEDLNVAFLDFRYVTRDAYHGRTLRTAAKLTWNANKELVNITIRKEEAAEVQDVVRQFRGVVDQIKLIFLGSWGLEYRNNNTESIWHGRLFTGLLHGTDFDSLSDIRSYKLTFGQDNFPRFTRIASSGRYDGRNIIATTKRGVGLLTERSAYGIYRIFKPMLNWDYVSGLPWSESDERAFVYYSPRPTVSFKLRVTEDISIQLGGVFSKILAGVYELTDPNYSTVIDPKNKTILIYATLQRGKATLEFSEFPLPESIYTVYLGKCITDEYGVKEADILPASRIGNYRASATPQGSAFSVSSGTANQELLLNWDAGNFTPLNPNREVGVDMSQFTGNVTFDEEASYVKVLQDGRFFVKDKAAAVEEFNGFIHVKSSGGVNGARGYLNGREIWKGKGTSWNRMDYSKYIVEGWNVVHMEWGDLWIEARLFKSKP